MVNAYFFVGKMACHLALPNEQKALGERKYTISKVNSN